MRKVLFVLMLAVLAIPVLAQERNRPRTTRPTRPSVSRPAPRPSPHYRPTYRPYYYHSYGYGSYGYSRYYGYGRSVITGLKFSLDLISEKDRAEVKKGVVTIDGAEIGIVNRHDGAWNGAIPVSAGDHEVVVERLDDDRVFRTQVFVQEGQVLHIYLRFPKP